MSGLPTLGSELDRRRRAATVRGAPRASACCLKLSEPMRFAISIPQYARDSRFEAAAFRAHLTRTEELGVFESGWVQEQVLGAAGSLAPLQTLTYAAACTERLRLGCAVFVLPLHNPVHLAKAISSLDCLSHGRVEVGLATGGRGVRSRPLAWTPTSRWLASTRRSR